MIEEKKVMTKEKKGGTSRVSGKYFRWVVPALGPDPAPLLTLKGDVLERLKEKEMKRGLEHYMIAAETHPTTGQYHLGILLLYDERRMVSGTYYDRLAGKHGNLTRYRTLNASILAYGEKEGDSPLTNIKEKLDNFLMEKRVSKGAYSILHGAMMLDPFRFDAVRFIASKGLTRAFSRTAWQKHLSMLRMVREDECNRILLAKPGLRFIDKALIEERLSPKELKLYNSWKGYGVIVDHLNQIPRWGSYRPFKTKNLFLVGRTGIGKTTLGLKIRERVAVYNKNVSNWFPRYRSGVYGMVLWDEFSLQTTPYPSLLMFLQGLQMDLQYKGGSVLRTGNQLVLMTSNLTLEMHIKRRFRSEENRNLSRENLRARITEVRVPHDLDLFLLLRLIGGDSSVDQAGGMNDAQPLG